MSTPQTQFRLGFFVHPLPYGLYTCYRNLRPALASRGIGLSWIGLGEDAAAAAADPAWVSELSHGKVLADKRVGDEAQARLLLEHVEAHCDGVLFSPPYHALEANLLRYLPPRIFRILSVQSMSRGIYRPITAFRDASHLAIASSPRVRDDLLRHSGFTTDRVITIPNGIDGAAFAADARPMPNPLRILYLGRVENNQKGVFWLPKMMEKLVRVNATLTVAGDGPDLTELKARCATLGDRVRFLGVVPTREVPALLAQHHALVMFSRSEGLPNVLLEALASGCVPVVSRIRGLTDWALERAGGEVECGMVFPAGDTRAAAECFARLINEPGRLEAMSQAARRRFEERFTAASMAEGYARAIGNIVANPPSIAPPLPLEKWVYPRQLGPSWISRLLPRRVKNLLLRWDA